MSTRCFVIGLLVAATVWGCAGDPQVTLGEYGSPSRGPGAVSRRVSSGELHVAPLRNSEGQPHLQILLMDGAQRLDQVDLGLGVILDDTAWGDRVGLQVRTASNRAVLHVFDAETGARSVHEEFEPTLLVATAEGFAGLRDGMWIRLDAEGALLDAQETSLEGAHLRNLGDSLVLLSQDSFCVHATYVNEEGAVQDRRELACPGGFAFYAEFAGPVHEGRVPILYTLDSGGAENEYDVTILGGIDAPLEQATLTRGFAPLVALDETGLHAILGAEYVRLDPVTLEAESPVPLGYTRALSYVRSSRGAEILHWTQDEEMRRTLYLRRIAP